MGIFKDIETKVGAVAAGEKATILGWIGSHKGWLVTTGVSHIIGIVLGKLL